MPVCIAKGQLCIQVNKKWLFRKEVPPGSQCCAGRGNHPRHIILYVGSPVVHKSSPGSAWLVTDKGITLLIKLEAHDFALQCRGNSTEMCAFADSGIKLSWE